MTAREEGAPPDDAAPDDSAPDGARPDGRTRRHALAWRITDRLNDVTRRFLGPAQLGDYTAPGPGDGRLPSTPCAKCGRPLDEHDLVRTEQQKMRLYCPEQ